MTGIFDKIPLKVIGYACTICNTWHRKGSKKFNLHFNKHFEIDGKYKPIRTTGENGKDTK